MTEDVIKGTPTILQQDHLQEAPRRDQTFWGKLSDAPLNESIRNQPNTSDKVQRTKTRRKAFNEIPASMKLLRKE